MGFKRQEVIALVTIFSILVFAIAINLQVSLRKSRDSQRKSDIRSIHDTLLAFKEEYGSFPASTADGKIVACHLQVLENGTMLFSPCEWLTDPLPPDLVSVPTDPHHKNGALYKYISNGRRFQVYGSLESADEAEYSQSIALEMHDCGNKTCNFGRSYKDTPLDKSLEEYENELREIELMELKLKLNAK